MRMKTLVIIRTVFSLVLVGGLIGCRPRPPAESTLPPVRVETLVAAESLVIVPVRTSGKLASRTESKLSFKTGGIIRSIHVNEGENVEAGQVLARLDLEEIKSQVNQSGLVLEKAERDHARAENLYRDSVATLEQLQNARTAMEIARSNARIAAFNLDYSTIRAPSRGKILLRIAEVNEIIGSGTPVFMFASTQSDWIVRASLIDQDVIRINLMDSAQVHFDAYPGETFMGFVSEIGTAADPYTGTYELEIQLLRKPERLVSGLIANTLIYPGQAEMKIMLPMESLVDGAGLTGYVYVLEENIPKRKKIIISRFLDSGIVVESGLLPGEEVITVGARYLDPDSRIERITSDL
jgi:RND family efflux transporter MFP subunit